MKNSVREGTIKLAIKMVLQKNPWRIEYIQKETSAKLYVPVIA